MTEIPYTFIFLRSHYLHPQPYITPAAPCLPLSSSLPLGSPHCSGGASAPDGWALRPFRSHVYRHAEAEGRGGLLGLGGAGRLGAVVEHRRQVERQGVLRGGRGGERGDSSRRRRDETARAAVCPRWPHHVRGGGARRPLRTGTMCDSKRHLTFQFESIVLLSVHGVDTGCIPCRLVMRML
eukprot:COSAG01_NODE_2340_length_7871_cov_32.734431_4_plen_181_part_00